MKSDLFIALCGLSKRDERSVHLLLASNSGVANCRTFQIVNHASLGPIEMAIVDERSPQGMDELKGVRDHHPGMVTITISDERSDEPGNVKLCRRTLLVDLLHVVNAQALTVAAQAIKRTPAAAQSQRVDTPAPMPTIATIGEELAAANAQRNSPITALIVEADAALRVEMKTALGRIGVRSIEAVDAEDALAHARHHHFDLAMLDVALKPVDGYSLCHALSQHPTTRPIPVLMLTDRASAYDRARAVTAGCKAFLVRPLHSATFYETVDRLLTRAFRNDRLQMKRLGYQTPTPINENQSRHTHTQDCPA